MKRHREQQRTLAACLQFPFTDRKCKVVGRTWASALGLAQGQVLHPSGPSVLSSPGGNPCTRSPWAFSRIMVTKQRAQCPAQVGWVAQPRGGSHALYFSKPSDFHGTLSARQVGLLSWMVKSSRRDYTFCFSAVVQSAWH